MKKVDFYLALTPWIVVSLLTTFSQEKAYEGGKVLFMTLCESFIDIESFIVLSVAAFCVVMHRMIKETNTY